ncbi:MAG: hypothetical protein WCY34_02875 [Candidatus Omnitrophota bacterium]|jgi:hypothetical protein
MRPQKILLLLVVFSCLNTFCWAGDIFKEISNAMAGKATKIELEALQKKYQGQRVEGKGKVVSVTNDVEGNKIVNLSLSAGGAGEASVDAIVFLRDYLKERTSKFRPGKRVRFSGEFKEILMNSIVIIEGIVK